jgi:hypothetical protein
MEKKMSKPKYKISINDLETKHNVAKLERDGFTRHDIIASVYKHAGDASDRERKEMVSKLFDRREK